MLKISTKFEWKIFKESSSHILNNSKNEFHMLVVLLNAHENNIWLVISF